MKHKLIPIFCIIAIVVAAAKAQTAQAPPKNPPPPASPGLVRNAGPSPEVQRLAVPQILRARRIATAQCDAIAVNATRSFAVAFTPATAVSVIQDSRSTRTLRSPRHNSL